MSHPTTPTVILALVLLLLGAATGAQAPQPPTYSQLVLDDLLELESKFTNLANAIPSDDYGWRPNSDARSVGQVFTHVASATYFYTQHLGTPIPKGAFRGRRNLEELTAKADVVAVLTSALDHARQHVSQHGAEPQSISLQMLVHLHEHLGQAIAYARSVGVTPPWSGDSG